jgi:hypothetical protein
VSKVWSCRSRNRSVLSGKRVELSAHPALGYTSTDVVTFTRDIAAHSAPGSTDSNGPSFPSESEAAMSNLINIRDRLLRDSFNRTVLAVICVAAIVVVIGVCVYSSYDGDKSSAVKNESPQAELNQWLWCSLSEGMRNMGKTKKPKIDKTMRKLKKAMKKADKKSKKVDRSDVPLVSPTVTTDLI